MPRKLAKGNGQKINTLTENGPGVQICLFDRGLFEERRGQRGGKLAPGWGIWTSGSTSAQIEKKVAPGCCLALMVIWDDAA